MNQPLISIVIPVYNEEKYISKCIKALKDQKCNFDYEIIVVNNNSTDNTLNIIEKLDVKVVNETRLGVGVARYKGASVAKGKYILNIDADTILPSNYIADVIKNFDNNISLACVGGQFFFYDAPWYVNLFRPAFFYLTKMFSFTLLGSKIGPMGNNMTFRKDMYDKTKGFNTNLKFGEDIDICKQLSKFGQIKLDMNLYCQVSARRYRLNKKLFILFFNLVKVLLNLEIKYDYPHSSEV